MGLAEEAITTLQQRGWPGNVRELRNALERAVILATGDEVDAKALDGEPPRKNGGSITLPPEGIDVETVVDELVRAALERCSGNQSATARMLGLSRDQVRYRMQKMGLLRKAGEDAEAAAGTA